MKDIFLKIITIFFILIPFVSTLKDNVKANEVSFSAETIIPNNQRNKDATYFDLRVSAGEKQEISIKLTNSTTKDIEIIPEINLATTNINGIVDYGKTTDKSYNLKYNIVDIIKPVEKTTKVKAQSSSIMKFQINLPTEAFDGIIAGGITLADKANQVESDRKESSFSIKNNFSYIIGILLNENDNIISSKLKMNNIYANTQNFRNVISSELINTMPKYMNNLDVTTTVSKIGSKGLFTKEYKKSIQMAPNSIFKNNTSLKGKKFTAGKYLVKTHVKSAEDEWDFRKTFEITESEAKEINEKDFLVNDNTKNLIIKGFIILGGIIILLFILILLFIKKRTN